MDADDIAEDRMIQEEYKVWKKVQKQAQQQVEDDSEMEEGSEGEDDDSGSEGEMDEVGAFCLVYIAVSGALLAQSMWADVISVDAVHSFTSGF
jgi:hypothetical protein